MPDTDPANEGRRPVTPAGDLTPGSAALGPPLPLPLPPSLPSRVETPGKPAFVFSDTVSRLAGYLVDGLIVGIVGGAVGVVIGIAAGVAAVDRVGGNASGLGGLSEAATATASVLGLLFGFAYYVFFWSSGRRATPGQRLFRIEVGNAFDGRPLTATQAARRWLAMGSPLGLLLLVRPIVFVGIVALLGWVLVLLVTTIRSPTKQGLHDRFANSAVVRPRGSTRTLACGCVIGVVLVYLVAVVMIGAAVALLGIQHATGGPSP